MTYEVKNEQVTNGYVIESWESEINGTQLIIGGYIGWKCEEFFLSIGLRYCEV